MLQRTKVPPVSMTDTAISGPILLRVASLVLRTPCGGQYGHRARVALSREAEK
jgi:hypothetical protein